MSHNIQAYIGRADALAHGLRDLKHALVVPLGQGFAAVPLTDALHDDDLLDLPERGDRPTVAELTITITGFGLMLSERAGPVAYVETNYFGGQGYQIAMAWDGGRVICPAQKGKLGTINRALAAIGVAASQGDAFDSLGLGRYREVEDLVRAASSA